MKRRKQLLEEAAKTSAGLVDASGKPMRSQEDRGKLATSRLVDAAGEPIERLHVTEDIDRAAGRSKHTMRSASAAMENVYDAKEGDTIEVCPEASMLMQEIIMWLEETKGGNDGGR